jgi:hypothetical protein
MAKNPKSVGSNGSVETYTDLYQKHLINKHGAIVTTETQTFNPQGKVFLSIDGKAYPTKRKATAADNKFRRLQKKNKEQRHQDAVNSIVRNENLLKNRGFRVTKSKKS